MDRVPVFAGIKIPIGFLFYSIGGRLEPLCGSGAFFCAGRDGVPFQPERLKSDVPHDGAFLPVRLPDEKGVSSMMDVILIGAATVFFSLCFAYTRACDRL
jgi:hypothetical protein